MSFMCNALPSTTLYLICKPEKEKMWLDSVGMHQKWLNIDKDIQTDCTNGADKTEAFNCF